VSRVSVQWTQSPGLDAPSADSIIENQQPIMVRNVIMKQLSSVHTAFQGALAPLLAIFCAGCTTTTGGQHQTPLHSLLHCKNEVGEFPVLITGLVKFPGRISIPPGGLNLQDAVGLAGGDQPAQQFPGTNPANVLVSLTRPTGTYHFSLPLVMQDVA